MRDEAGKVAGFYRSETEKTGIVPTQTAPDDPGERARRESAERYHALFRALDQGFCIVELVFDERKRPIDYIFIETNPAFEAQTGLDGAAGKSMRSLRPEHEDHWFEIYGRIH
jgi:PAS domain-containing protein